MLLTSDPELLSSCALYVNKNPSNRPIIMRILISRMRDLVDSPIPSDPREALARTLAITIYHVIALLDGDIEARAAAESTLHALDTAGRNLIPHTNLTAESTHPATLPLYPLGDTEAFWKNWVLTESIRRTMLFAHQFDSCYSLIQGGSIDCDKLSRFQLWTLSAPLWHADNAVDFAVAWGSRRRWLMNVIKTDGAFDGAAADDVCDFGRIFMSCFMGHQQARGWFAAKGGKF